MSAIIRTPYGFTQTVLAYGDTELIHRKELTNHLRDIYDQVEASKELPRKIETRWRMVEEGDNRIYEWTTEILTEGEPQVAKSSKWPEEVITAFRDGAEN